VKPIGKRIIWMGGAKIDLMRFPAEARRDCGHQLRKVQMGEDPHDWKPMPAVGSGVREIRVHESAGEFRVMYVAARPEGIYVLHCFQKKSEKTSRHDCELAARRFSAIFRIVGTV